MDKLEKRPISEVLREMPLGAIEAFPKSQYRSLTTLIPALGIETGFKFVKSVKDNCIIVTRYK